MRLQAFHPETDIQNPGWVQLFARYFFKMVMIILELACFHSYRYARLREMANETLLDCAAIVSNFKDNTKRFYFSMQRFIIKNLSSHQRSAAIITKLFPTGALCHIVLRMPRLQ
jgi:hypothetical protein